MGNKRKISSILLWVLVALVFIIGLLHLISMVTLDKKIQYIQRPLVSSKLSPALDGLRVVWITDTHAMEQKDVEQVVEAIQEQGVDLLLLGGDYGGNNLVWEQMEAFGRTNAPLGIYGVAGNHDRLANIYPAMEANQITPLDNAGLRITENLFIAGVNDLWNDNPDVQKAVKHATAQDYVLLLAHNPDIIMEQPMDHVDYTLSGHTHGGHVTFFGWYAPAISQVSRYGHRFLSGECENDQGNLVYVSNGTGWYNSIPRVFARPQVITFVLQSAQ